MITQRFNTSLEWRGGWPVNHTLYGFIQLLEYLESNIEHKVPRESKMIEIGSYMGESTMLFASTGIFQEIHAIEPFEGKEKFSDDFGYEWEQIGKEFEKNTRIFDDDEIINLHLDYSYNVHERFEDGTFNFVYIDGDHSYDGVKRDIELYLPKIKEGGIIGGHDYNKKEWEGVVKAVNEYFTEPDFVFRDLTWVKKINPSKEVSNEDE